MRTYVITGGTDGIGKGLGLHFLARGDRAVAVGSSQDKGQAFLSAAEGLGAADRARFLRADLSSVAGMRSAVAEVGDVVERIDGLVFAAQRFRSRRRQTVDGLEHTFALSYLSRFVLGHELAGKLDLAENPVIFNLAGSGGLPGRIRWDDLQLREKYSGLTASTQSARCNDLLGVDFPRRRPNTHTRYILYNPLFVKTGMAKALPQPQRALTSTLSWLLAQRVDKAIQPMIALMDSPPAEPVAAFKRGARLSPSGADFDSDAADRLHRLTAALISELRG